MLAGNKQSQLEAGVPWLVILWTDLVTTRTMDASMVYANQPTLFFMYGMEVVIAVFNQRLTPISRPFYPQSPASHCYAR